MGPVRIWEAMLEIVMWVLAPVGSQGGREVRDVGAGCFGGGRRDGGKERLAIRGGEEERDEVMCYVECPHVVHFKTSLDFVWVGFCDLQLDGTGVAEGSDHDVESGEFLAEFAGEFGDGGGGCDVAGKDGYVY